MIEKRIAATILLLYVVLGNWKGYLAIYEGGAEEPRQIYPQKIEMLPEEDQAALEEGILIRSQQRLEALLEDYLS